MKVVVVDPISSGAALADALRERGTEPFLLYRPVLAGAFAADPAPGGKLLHESFDDTLAVLRDMGVEAVVAGTETGVTLADELAAALGLPHNAPERAEARRSKLHKARALAAAGVPGPVTVEVGDLAAVPAALAAFTRFPVVVKPVASAGSDGLAVCADAEQVHRAVGELLGTASAVGGVNDTVLLQEHLTGTQYVVNAVSVAGRHVLTDVWICRFDEIEGRPILRHQVSHSTLDPAEWAVVEYTFACLDALGVANCATHSEIRLTPDGPRLIEVNYRLMGLGLAADVFVQAHGYSHATLFADALLGRPEFDAFAARPYQPRGDIGFVMMRAAGRGTVSAMPGLDEIRRLPTFRCFIRLPQLGMQIKDPLMTTGTAGVAYYSGPDAAAIVADMEATHDIVDSGRLYTMSDS
ncbi:ATP-grasp domain-containing protein [Catellatospora methionotrophica]|uniref:ATP-grasp domain-containing protein n=1 Tax=Catellatospora methionotrophica TaxID=121620 RepID=UPI0033CF5433